MPTYAINGKRIRTEAPLSDAQIDEIAADLAKTAPSEWDAGTPTVAGMQSTFDEGMPGQRFAPEQRIAQLQAAANAPLGQSLRNVAGGVAMGGATFLPDKAEREQAILNVTGADPAAYNTKLARLATEAGGFMGAGKLAGAGASALGAPGVGAALESAGFAKDLPWWARAAGGGAIGAASGALGDRENMGNAAMMGAGLGAAAPFALPAAARAAGWVYDAASGRLAQIQGGRIVREVAGDQLPAIQAAMRGAPQDVTATQAAYGINKPEFFALGENMLQFSPAERESILSAQRAAQQNELARLASGATQTEARAGRESAKRTLTAITRPMMAENLERSNVGGNVMLPLEQRAAKARAAATQSVEDTRRMTAAAERADALSRAPVTSQPVNVPLPGAEPYPISAPRSTTIEPGIRPGATQAGFGLRSAQAESAAQQAADESLMYGAQARGNEARVQALRDMGLAPLDTSGVTGYLRQTANQPGTRADPVQKEILTDIATQIDDLARQNGGVIDAADLYQLRKTGINDMIRRKLSVSGMEPKAQDKRVAELLSPVKSLIDDAIEKAGGAGWRDYLRTFEQGMHGIEQQKLAAKAMEMYNKSPTKFLELVNGNNPKAIEKIFGPGSYDIVREMGAKMTPLRNVAGQLERDIGVKKTAEAGQANLARILDADRSWPVKFASRLIGTKTGVSPEAVIQTLENSLSKNTQDALARGFQSGANMNQLLNALPTLERQRVLRALAPYGVAGVSAGVNALVKPNE